MVPMATPERSAKLSYQFRFVADARGAYRSTAARVVAYARAVLGMTGSACTVFRSLLTREQKKFEAVLLYLVQSAKSLDALQHNLMEVQWFFRLGTLIAVPVDKLIEDLKKKHGRA
jgi:hypothetical protein